MRTRSLRHQAMAAAASIAVAGGPTLGHTASSGQAPGSQAPSAQAVVSVDFGAAGGPLLHAERYNNLTDFDRYVEQRPKDVAFYNAQGLHGSIYRTWLAEKLYDPASGTYNADAMAPYLADASTVSDSILLNVMPSELILEGKTPEEIEPILVKLIGDLKRRFPKLDYIEAFNEPDHSLSAKLKPADLYRYYVPFYKAVNAVNLALKPERPIKLGGPALFMFDEPWIEAFLDGYRADPSPDKRLDFLSYHAYGFFYLKPGTTQMTRPPVFFKDDPMQVAGRRAVIEADLKSRGLDPHLPSYITELGLYPGPSFDDMADPHPDYLRQAAGVASLIYAFLQNPDTVPFNWVMRHQSEERKDQLVTRAGKDKPIPVNTFSPYGDMMVMLSRLKANRVPARSDLPLDHGKGVYAIASRDRSGAAILVWNYQHTDQKSVTTRIQLDGLPAALRGRRLHERLFRIDATTSNYWAAPLHANLQQVGEAQVRVRDGRLMDVDLTPNALELIVLDVPRAAAR